MLSKEEKLKKAQETKAAINKDHGKGSIMGLADIPLECEVVSTGSIRLNKALGILGLPKGRIVEVMGYESSGKTTLCMHIMAEAQKAGGLCAIIDAEHAFDSTYATQLGLNVDELDISQPETGEQALAITEKLVNSGVYDVIVIDSVAALVPKAEIEGSFGDTKMGLHARLMSQAMRKLSFAVLKHNVCLIFINQFRQKMVMMGNPDVTTGGVALRFFSSVRLEVVRSLTTDNSVFGVSKDDKIGNQTTVKVIKNKLAPPFKKAEFDILYGVGIDKIGEIIEEASSMQLIRKWGDTITTKAGEKYPLKDYRNMLMDNPDFYKELEQQCYAG